MQTKKTFIRYSEAFKTQVLNEIEAGSLSPGEARIKYHIKGTHTIQQWARKYARFGILPKVIRVEKPNERNQLKALKEENKRLKEALADMLLDQRIAESTLEVICDQQGWDIEQIKKSWHVIAEKTTSKGEKVSTVCTKMGKSRAAYYKQLKQQTEKHLEGCIVHELVLDQRKDMPRLGGKKLYHLLRASFQEHNIGLGRDRFFNWLKQHDLLVQPKKRFTKTTHSQHRFRIHKNLINDIKINRPDQVWMSDITYLRLQHGFCYLALITDAFSRKIIGYHVNNTLELKGCLNALKMACQNKRSMNSPIHHSDRGIQYCSNRYIEQLTAQGIKISMGEAGNCYENALAERVNGILKNEFNLDSTFAHIIQAEKSVQQAVEIYNEKRPHMSIGMKKPTELYAA